MVCGPTASGKSDAADRLAGGLEREAGWSAPTVVVDSMQVYRELPVVTNQSREREAELTGAASVFEEWTVARHKEAAERVIRQTQGPFVLDAGTGMYLNALILDLDLAPKVTNEFREEARRRSGAEENSRREARRIELELAGAKERGSIWDGELRYPSAVLYIRPAREDLDRNISRRSAKIARDGAEEVAEVLERSAQLGASPNDSAEQSIGFKEMAEYVRGETTRQWAEQKISSRTRKLARRQMRWFDKLCQSLPEEARVEVCESPREEKAASYMRGIIEAWM